VEDFPAFPGYLLHKIMKELIINIYMLIKSVIKLRCRRLIVVILRLIKNIGLLLYVAYN
jgi:hypothetical protein